MKQYLDLVRDVLEFGVDKSDRTGTGTLSVFGRMMRFDLNVGFPLLTTKKVHFKSIAHELLWFLKGTDDTSYLKDHGVSIWREWETQIERADGSTYPSIGPLYGVNWLHFKTHDGREINQIDQLVDELKLRPDSRRLIVSAWNPATLPDPAMSPHDNVRAGKGALAPCHAFFQFHVAQGRLSCMLTQRSADLFLGVPFNIASYSLLTLMLAQQTGLQPGEFVWSGGDVHIYKNHLEQVQLQLTRTPKALPQLKFRRHPESIYAYNFDDFELSDYEPEAPIKAPVSI
ncbi:MAG: thymidylate synthase [Deltaproteobacteria bacterium]|nr:thymidylate synthase [Deltaproteobacteria bacterium]